ncbi:hypothetical protein HTSR_0325 [Halodesulfurarchaeum formicicum]|uniref:Uncharacterized protein n=1 Tax=Halodesulfurarchaeum formicicum TaxID=1873524 RepID=A0A1D8S2F3_9EURY|nr:hypothetical protein [Halodesulfurarchaeum formicicum]AOW79526.1 hypothetical protein HTSR_0325 [Halodesulfurarchaeum formicicum]
MAQLGIVDLVTLGGTLLFALPIGVFGLSLLARGELLLGFVGTGVAAGLVMVERLLWTPEDVPGEFLQSLADRIVERPPEDQ